MGLKDEIRAMKDKALADQIARNKAEAKQRDKSEANGLKEAKKAIKEIDALIRKGVSEQVNYCPQHRKVEIDITKYGLLGRERILKHYQKAGLEVKTEHSPASYDCDIGNTPASDWLIVWWDK